MAGLVKQISVVDFFFFEGGVFSGYLAHSTLTAYPDLLNLLSNPYLHISAAEFLANANCSAWRKASTP